MGKLPKTSPGRAPKAAKDQRLSHAEALTKAKADAAEAQLQLPFKLSSGVRIVKYVNQFACCLPCLTSLRI